MSIIVSRSLGDSDNVIIYDKWNIENNKRYNIIKYMNHIYNIICIKKNKPNLCFTKIIFINNENNFNFTSTISLEDIEYNINEITKKNNDDKINFTYILSCELNPTILKNMYIKYKDNDFIKVLYENKIYNFCLNSGDEKIEKSGMLNYCYILYIIKYNLLKLKIYDTYHYNNININEVPLKGTENKLKYTNAIDFAFEPSITYRVIPYFDISSLTTSIYNKLLSKKKLKQDFIHIKKNCSITNSYTFRCCDRCFVCCSYIISYYNNKILELKNNINDDNHEYIKNKYFTNSKKEIYYYDEYNHN